MSRKNASNLLSSGFVLVVSEIRFRHSAIRAKNSVLVLSPECSASRSISASRALSSVRMCGPEPGLVSFAIGASIPACEPSPISPSIRLSAYFRVIAIFTIPELGINPRLRTAFSIIVATSFANAAGPSIAPAHLRAARSNQSAIVSLNQPLPIGII